MSVRAGFTAQSGVVTGVSASSETERLLEQTRRLEQLNSWFELAINNMARGLSMFDSERRLVVCNSTYREIYELPEALTLPGTHMTDIVAFFSRKEGGTDTADDRACQSRWIDQHAAKLSRGKSFTHTQHLSNGRIILVTNQPLSDGGWVDIQEDVTEKTRAQDRISWLACHDALTETVNRFHFHQILEQKIKDLAAGTFVAVHLIDLDRFKPINDTLGHAAGDMLLKTVAKRMRATVREHDVVGRLGGDEFAILQTDVASVEHAESLAKRLLKVLNAPYRVMENVAHVGASIGVVVAPTDGSDAGTLLRRADMALYRVKSGGRGALEFYKPEFEKGSIQADKLETDLFAAFEARELELFYQPILDVETHRVTSCEALMRWRHPELGMIPPATFISLAEKSRLIVEIGDWALQQACKDAAQWSDDVKVTVNLSAVQLDKGDVFKSVAKALSVSGLSAERLELEITETVLLRNEERVQSTLLNLRSLGVKLALDDFGTAFSSLSYLRNFAFDRLKIDRSFVREVSERKDCLAIINAVTGLARSLDIGTVAEGVETIEQLNTVQNAGCNEVQGFYFSQAVPASEIRALFASLNGLQYAKSIGAL